MKRINDEEIKFSVDVKYTDGQSVCSPLPEVKTKGEAVIYAKTRAAYEQNVEYVELLYLDKNGIDALFEILKEIDPESAAIIHKNNTKKENSKRIDRIQRILH